MIIAIQNTLRTNLLIQQDAFNVILDKNLLNSRLSELSYLLHQRNYPKSMVEHGINKVTCHDKNELLQIKDKAENVLYHTFQHRNCANNIFSNFINIKYSRRYHSFRVIDFPRLSSTELKAHVSFTYHFLSGVRPSVCLFVFLFVFLHFRLLVQKPTGQFQLKLAQSIIE